MRMMCDGATTQQLISMTDGRTDGQLAEAPAAA